MLGRNHCTPTILVFLLLRVAFASSLSLPVPAHNASASATRLDPNPAPIVVPGKPYCRVLWGNPVNQDSCRNARDKIERSTHPQKSSAEGLHRIVRHFQHPYAISAMTVHVPSTSNFSTFVRPSIIMDGIPAMDAPFSMWRIQSSWPV